MKITNDECFLLIKYVLYVKKKNININILKRLKDHGAEPKIINRIWPASAARPLHKWKY